MPRIACLLVPDLPIAASCRADPALAGRPIVLAERDGAHARVVAASAAARARGVVPGGHSVAQARAVAADLVIRPRDPAVEASAARALADVAASLASRLECTADGTVFLDATGAAHLTASERGLASALVARATRVGLEARVGIGPSMIVARLAALHGDGCEVVPSGTELGFLAPLPLACLAPAPDVAGTLARWGVHRLGDLARLPVAEIAVRLGAAGVDLARAARGEDTRPLAPSPPPTDVEEAATFEYAIETLEPLLFVLRGLVERAVARLGLDGIGCARIGLVLGLDDRGRDVRTLDLAAPTRDVKTLLGCLRVALESRTLRAAVVSVAVTAMPERVRAAQLGLFVPPGPAPERLATTLARLATLCGPGRVGAPVVVDTHRPGAAEVGAFLPPPSTIAEPAPPPAPCRLAVRVLRPPRPLEVFSERDVPCFVRGTGLGGRVVAVAGPWRIAAEWWRSLPCARDYYDLELTDGGLYRCYRETATDSWFVDGMYD
jgi:protein ImuB